MGGYRRLLVYRLAVTIFDFVNIFCERYIDKKSRTYDQMIQAARSGKQNIAEGSKEISAGSDMLLNSVSRSSYTELAEDFEDYLRLNGLPLWSKTDRRVILLRKFKEDTDKVTTLSQISKWSNLDFDNPENFSNMMITFCNKQGYLMDQLLRSKKAKFVKEGGFRENLFKKRREYIKGR